MGPRNHVLDEGRDPPHGGAISGKLSRPLKSSGNLCAV